MDTGGVVNQQEITFDDLIDRIFVKNVSNQNIVISELIGVDNTKELFYFCVDLFVNGIRKTYNYATTEQINIAELSLEQIDNIRQKMANLGITVHLQPVEITKDHGLYRPDNKTHIFNMIPKIMKKNEETGQLEPSDDDNETTRQMLAELPLKEYLLIATHDLMSYEIRFEVKAKN